MSPTSLKDAFSASGSAVGRPRTIVIVVAYHSDPWLPECMRTLSDSWDARDLLLVVDNSGNSNLPTAAGLIPHSRVLTTSSSLGFAAANNFALLRGGLDGTYVCLLNQDTLSEPGWLAACVRRLEERPDVGAISPLLKTIDGGEWDAGFADCACQSAEFCRAKANNVISGSYEVPQVTAAAMVVRSEVLRRVGPFDPIFGSYYEDFDLCRRISEAGYRIEVCSDGVVRHFGGSVSTTTAARNRRTRQVLRNRAIARVRAAGTGRKRAFMKILRSIPQNLLRGIIGTPSSQPIGVQLAAYCDLLRLAPRITSVTRDTGRWNEYLREIGWPAR